MRHSTPTPDAPQQIHLRLFAWIDSARGRVPERALWRETIDLAILTAEATAFVVHGRKIAAAVVHHLAWVIHSLTNSAGIAHASDDDLARHAHRDAKTVSRALIVLNRIHAVRSTRDSRRTKRFHAMNLGGLSWPAIRQRARLRRTVEAAYGGQQLPLPDYPSGGHTPPLSGGHTPPLRGVRTLGVKISDPVAVADPPRGREAADQQKQQQQQPNTINGDNDKSHERDEHRINGLIAYLAVTSRRQRGAAPFNETATRENIAAGRTTVLDLQAQADQFREDDRIRREAHDAAEERRQRRAVLQFAWLPATTPNAEPILVYDWRENVLHALRCGGLSTQTQRDRWSASGRDAGIADPDTEITTILRTEPEEHEKRAGYNGDKAPQGHELAASATPAPGTDEPEDHEEPGQTRDTPQDPDLFELSATPAAADPGDHPIDTPPPTLPAKSSQQPSASGAGPRRPNAGAEQPHHPPAEPVEPAETLDPSTLRATFDRLTGRKHEWRDRD